MNRFKCSSMRCYFLIECLESVYQIDYPNYGVIIVDNGSNDESLKKIREYAQGQIKIDSEFFQYEQNSKPILVTEYTSDEV